MRVAHESGATGPLLDRLFRQAVQAGRKARSQTAIGESPASVSSAAAALADVPDGATVMIGGFGTAGLPNELIDALIDQGARDLTIVTNNDRDFTDVPGLRTENWTLPS